MFKNFMRRLLGLTLPELILHVARKWLCSLLAGTAAVFPGVLVVFGLIHAAVLVHHWGSV